MPREHAHAVDRPVEVSEADVIVDGRRWRYYHAGEGSGRAIVLVHGFHGSGRFFGAPMRELADGWMCVAPDLPGHGSSEPWPPEVDVVEQWELLDGFLEALGIRDAAVVGHSRGGHVSVQLAARRPGRVRALMVYGAPGRAFKVGTLDVARMFVDPGAMPPDFMARIRECTAAARGYDTARARAIGAGALERDLGPVLGKVRAPTLVAWGEADWTIPEDVSRYIAEGIPGSEWRVVGGAGHMWPFERPREFATAVRGFLLEHTPPGS
jgi:pimeloyl-ACP methyl ester carboxylesterase